ncbi:hypothetical protein A6A08_21120 [Nocardiopsis sp. TSRI0078]|nr:hypothetical protein A6A08_21120 [Nocardiopsis sp. TSRI0078]
MKRYDEARTSLHAALPIWAGEEDAQDRGRVLLALSWVEEDEERYEASLSYAEESLQRFLDCGSSPWEGRARKQVALCSTYLGDSEQAEQQVSKALQIHERNGDQDGIAHALNTWGTVHKHLRNYPLSSGYLEDAAQKFHDLRDYYYEARTLMLLGDVEKAQNDPFAARAAWRKCLEVIGQIWELSPDPVHERLRSLDEGQTR